MRCRNSVDGRAGCLAEALGADVRVREGVGGRDARAVRRVAGERFGGDVAERAVSDGGRARCDGVGSSGRDGTGAWFRKRRDDFAM